MKIKKVKGYESGGMPIYLRISVDGKRSEATIGRGVKPENGIKTRESSRKYRVCQKLKQIPSQK